MKSLLQYISVNSFCSKFSFNLITIGVLYHKQKYNRWLEINLPIKVGMTLQNMYTGWHEAIGGLRQILCLGPRRPLFYCLDKSFLWTVPAPPPLSWWRCTTTNSRSSCAIPFLLVWSWTLADPWRLLQAELVDAVRRRRAREETSDDEDLGLPRSPASSSPTAATPDHLHINLKVRTTTSSTVDP